MSERKKHPSRRLVVAEQQHADTIDLDAWVQAYVAAVMELDGWRVAGPRLVSVA